MPSAYALHPLGRPGSEQARANGCNCPRAENRHGEGLYIDSDGVPVFAVRNSCPIHANPKTCQPLHMEQPQ